MLKPSPRGRGLQVPSLSVTLVLFPVARGGLGLAFATLPCTTTVDLPVLITGEERLRSPDAVSFTLGLIHVH